jgi:predicted GNAT family N-acyltransferase
MNALAEISSPVSVVEAGRKKQVKSINSWHSSKLIHRQNSLSTELLTDPSRLQEIYDLRLEVWEHSGNNEFVNRQLFPNGWYDELDESAFHWVTFNDQNKIIAAARLNIFHSLEQSPYYDSIRHLAFPTDIPFAFYSRLVVHPQYRHKGLSQQLYNGRAQYCIENEIKWSQVFINNSYVIGLFEKEGFENIGQAEINYHISSHPHSVNVFVKENNCRQK